MDSSVAYQGIARGLGRERVADLSLWATGGLRPDLTVLLDVDPALGLARLEGPDRLEAEPLEWHQRVRAGFCEIAADDPQRYLVLDGSRPAEDLAIEIAARVDELLGDR
jgi:dTMP kinase